MLFIRRGLTAVALVAACGGHVDGHDQSASGGRGGAAVEPGGGDGGSMAGEGGSMSGVGGVGGTNYGTGGAIGSSGGGFGGTSFGVGSCFVAGTSIATPSGAVPIEKLQLGDLVLAYDERAARVVTRPVTATFVHPDHPVGSLVLNDGRSLSVTANHPIYLPDEDRYVSAGELEGDERLLTLNGLARTTSAISAGFREATGTRVTVHNITVAGEHNYFAEGVLVHNKTDSGPPCGTVFWSGPCFPAGLCLDPQSPSPEYVPLNRPSGGDAGVVDADTHDHGDVDHPVDGGPSDAAPVSRESSVESGVGSGRPIGAVMCDGGSVPPNPSYLAFEVWGVEGSPPAIGIYSGARECTGDQVGEFALFGPSAPPAGTLTTQCVRVPQKFLDQVTIVPSSFGTRVENPRFVAGCECPRPLALRTSLCGVQGPDGGSGCE